MTEERASGSQTVDAPGTTAAPGRKSRSRKYAEQAKQRAVRERERAAREHEHVARERSGRLAAASGAGTVTMQARVDADFARELKNDAAVLGLRSTSALVREGLRLVHKQARELAMADSHDEFYGGQPAPVSQVTAALWSD